MDNGGELKWPARLTASQVHGFLWKFHLRVIAQGAPFQKSVSGNYSLEMASGSLPLNVILEVYLEIVLKS